MKSITSILAALILTVLTLTNTNTVNANSKPGFYETNSSYMSVSEHPRRKVWIRGHYVRRHRRLIWIPGHWKRVRW